jgi:iron complex outermembrane receptor protein
MNRRYRLLLSTALAGMIGHAGVAVAQDAVGKTASPVNQLEEIVVTAQKRAQSLQDVPIAVTALSEETLQANRVINVRDLSGLAPGVIVRTAAGGSALPTFSIRGAISYGVVPGSDKQVSLYLDGVYLASARGAIFDLPDVARIEVLRGPQGTLFGRNATAGAVSITTRDPTGEFSVKQEFTAGNYDHFRTRTSINLPQVGPVSAYVTYVHNYRRGDIRNAGAGQVWDRTAAGYGTATSPKWLGTQKSDSVFAAVKFEPNDTFSTVYKFDYNKAEGTPEGTGFVGYNPAAAGIGVLIGPVLAALINNQPTPFYIAPDGKRPKIVNNSWVIPTRQKTYGHSFTSTLQLSDKTTVKNTLAYRNAYIFATSPIDGLSGLKFTQQGVIPFATFQAIAGRLPPSIIPTIAAGLQAQVGQPIVILGTQPETKSRQVSDELQLNYDSRLLTLTLGAVWFHSSERSNPPGLPSTTSFSIVPNGVLGLGQQGVNYNRQTSLAGYGQAEVHLTSQLDLVAGVRLTSDKKEGEFIFGLPTSLTTIPFTYKKTKPNYLIGVNYKPTEDVLLYGKFSTAFVSGGSVGTISFEPETAESWEAGVKADLFAKRLRTNLSVYHVTYKHFQTAQGANNFPTLPNSAVLGTIVLDQGGPVKAKGFEFEATAAPVRGLRLGGSLAYMDTKFSEVNPIIVAQAGGQYDPTYRAKWTGGLWGQYETEPLLGEARLILRADGLYHSKFQLAQNRNRNVAAFKGIDFVSASWMVNARAALRDIRIGDRATAEVAVWAKNLTQNREPTFSLATLNLVGAANYVPARTVGVDLLFAY